MRFKRLCDHHDFVASVAPSPQRRHAPARGRRHAPTVLEVSPMRHPKRLSALGLAAALALAGCQNPNGSTDWGSTLLLGAGVGVAAALVAGAASDQGDGRRAYRPSYERGPRYGYADSRYAPQRFGRGTW